MKTPFIGAGKDQGFESGAVGSTEGRKVREEPDNRGFQRRKESRRN
jgi:hypothetical protein